MHRIITAALITSALAGCGTPEPMDAGHDAAAVVDAEAGTDVVAIDVASDVPIDRPRIDDFVFNDVVDDADHDAGGGMLTGTLVGGTGTLPGPIAGVHYRTGTIDDVTDAAGTFHYTPGAMITFQIADVSFRAAPARARLSPFQLVGTGACVHSTVLENALVLLYSLDADGDPATGLTLPTYSTVPATRTINDLSLGDVATLVDQLIPGRTPLSSQDATDRFIHVIDDEVWMETGLDAFRFLAAVTRGQGVASNGTELFFSSTDGLERTDTAYHREAVNPAAIPSSLSSMGSDHIGDIDALGGTLYVPVEDGPAYTHPNVVFYDAQTLSAGMVFPISNTLQTEGVPWVAVNAAAGELYLAEWNPTPQLNIFSLATVAYLRSVPFRPIVGRIQGAKMFDGALYLSSDETMKSVYKANIETGTIIHLFDLPITSENEGLAFFMRDDGSQMHTLNVAEDRAGTELRHHQRTRDPLRHLICP